MTKADAKERIQKLRKEIEHHRTQYHVFDQQTISDAALDSLKHELYALEREYPDLITPDSPTQRIGGKPLPKFEKVKHTHPMLSMEDVFTPEEFNAWHARIAKLLERDAFELFCMVKLDGLAIELVYRGGLLETASTRGDGMIGEDITQNVRTIQAIPLRIDEEKEVIVRGEIYFPVKAFEKLNAQLKKAGEAEFVNPRNAAAGAVRQLDPAITASRPLSFFAWDLQTDLGQKTHADEWKILQNLGFPVNPEAGVASSVSEVRAFWDKMQKRREKLNYWIDGTVVRVNDNRQFEDLGIVGKTPRGLVAWKFAAEEATTVIEAVEWFVGRTGALTPVAIVKPTFVAGTTVQHASLHNMDEIERLDVHVGDTIILYKAGDIIPKVKEVLKNLRPKGAKEIHAPIECPVCGSAVARRENEVAIYCTNKRCFAQDQANILHAARSFGIDGLGPATVGLLLDNKVVQRAPDLFRLKESDLLELERFAEVSSQKLVEELQAHKEIALDHFLVALGIRHVGGETAAVLAREFGTLEAIMKASVEELAEVEGVGEVVGASIAEFFSEKHNLELVEDYKNVGIKVLGVKPKAKGKFTGQTFVLTGTLEKMSREVAKTKIQSHGGDVSETVSKKTSYVVVGESPGSKLDKAKKLGVPTLTEAEFLRIL